MYILAKNLHKMIIFYNLLLENLTGKVLRFLQDLSCLEKKPDKSGKLLPKLLPL